MAGIDPTKSANFGLGPILQAQLTEAPWMSPHTRRLPGVGPLDPGDWLRVDDAFAAQMALRDRLVADHADDVRAALPGSSDAVDELLTVVLDEISSMDGYQVGPTAVSRPDGVVVPLDGDPLLTLGRLVVEDFCVLQSDASGPEHKLTAAILCFPMQWSLSEKLGRPLTGVHDVVPPYDGEVAKRVQRLFDAIRPGRGLWRTNSIAVSGVELFAPRAEAKRPPDRPRTDQSDFIRSERQCLIRLPESDAVVFSIHTRLVSKTSLSAEQAEMLTAHPINRQYD